MVTWLHGYIYAHTVCGVQLKEEGLLSEDHLPLSMTQSVQLLDQAIHLHPNNSPNSLRTLEDRATFFDLFIVLH